MTALPSSHVAGPTDAELACAAAAGDRRAFAQIYDRYADRLHDFCIGMLRDRDGAADCVQDVFCTAATALSQLREPDKLRPWLYAIARSEALRRIRHRRREHLFDDLPEVASGEPGPDTLAARSELADLIAQAAGGLSDRDRSVLELTYRHGLSGPELARALGVSQSNANVMVGRLRETIERSLGALLVARQARTNPAGCSELAAILNRWDGQFTVLMRKRIARHIESCPTCDQRRRRLVSPAALLGSAPVLIPAPDWLRRHTLGQIRLTSGGAGAAADPGNGPGQGGHASALPQPRPNPASLSSSTVRLGRSTGQPPDNPLAYADTAAAPAGSIPTGAAGRAATADDQHDAAARDDLEQDHHARRAMVLVALLAATLFASAGLTFLWLHHQRANTSITPADLHKTAPPTAIHAPAPVPPNKNPPAAPTAGFPSPLPAPPDPVSDPVQVPAPAGPTQAPNVIVSTPPGPARAPVVPPGPAGAPPPEVRPQPPGLPPRAVPSPATQPTVPIGPTPPRHPALPSLPPPKHGAGAGGVMGGGGAHCLPAAPACFWRVP
jgi:RNA polymerase sigma factor (sigma-70 family)